MKALGAALIAAIAAVVVTVLLLRPVGAPDVARIESVSRCEWTEYCRAGDCTAQPLPAFTILRNGEFGRTYLGFEGDRGMPQVSVVPSDDGTRQMSLSAGQTADGVEILHVWTLKPDGAFDYRRTEQLISNPAIDTGAGQCGAFEDREAG
ncbi:hypothetical protein [Psychromarinibacter sp. S121]|uniref:hypothetical protein n=1 Tax=Psychromarinibacter sp. S121 TaxID=3415127 RepID=UPI003C7DEF29